MQRRGLSATAIKLMALLFMSIDHIGFVFAPLGAPEVLRWIGRLAAPLFFYMASEGFRHTSNIKRYLARLYAFFAVMSLGSFAVGLYCGVAPPMNIFETIFIFVFISYTFSGSGPVWFIIPLLAFGAVSFLPELGIASRVIDLLVPSLFGTEGGILMTALGVCFCLLPDKSSRLIALAFVSLASVFMGFARYQCLMVLAGILIYFYSEARRPSLKWLFYIYYPVHIWALYIYYYSVM